MQGESLIIGLEGAYWYQPKLGSLNPLAKKCRASGYGAVNSEIKIGYKSNGFKENLPLKNSFIAQIGLKLDI